MDILDQEIVAACNKLMELKLDSARQRVDSSNEKARLKRELEHTQRDWESSLRSFRMTKDLAAYKEACALVFEEDGIKVPPLAAARQAQLCLHVHLMTSLENQRDMLENQLKKEFSALEMASKKVREGISEAEILLLNGIVQIQQEKAEFIEWTKEPIAKRKREKKQQQAKDMADSSQTSSDHEASNSSMDKNIKETSRSSSLEKESLSDPSPLLMRRQSTGGASAMNASKDGDSNERNPLALPASSNHMRRQSTGAIPSVHDDPTLMSLHEAEDAAMEKTPSFKLKNSLKMVMPSRPTSLSQVST